MFIIHKMVSLPLGKFLKILLLMNFNILIHQVLNYVASIHKELVIEYHKYINFNLEIMKHSSLSTLVTNELYIT